MTVLFLVGVGGAVFLLLSPALGLPDVFSHPLAAGGVTTILAFVLTRKNWRKDKTDESTEEDA